MGNIALNKFEEFDILYSSNMRVYEAVNEYVGCRSFVLVPASDVGFCIVYRRIDAIEYKVLKRWYVIAPAAVKFLLDQHATYKLHVRLVETMTAQWSADKSAWDTIRASIDIT